MIRIVWNTVLWFSLALSWALTFIPTTLTHDIFKSVGGIAVLLTIIKWFSLLIIKGSALVADNYERDYSLAESSVVMKMFPDGLESEIVLDYMLEFIGLLG